MEVNKLKSGRVYALLLFVGITLAGGCYFYYQYVNPERFAPGVEIGGIPVSGYDRQQAAEVVRKSVSAVYADQVTFYKDDYKQETKLGDLCIPLDAAIVTESVWQQEKTRDWQAKIANLNGQQKVIYPIILTYDPAVQTRMVQEWDARWGRPAQNATIEVESQRGLIVVPGQSGLKVDAEATFRTLPRQVTRSSDLRVPIIVTPQEALINQDMLRNMGELASFSTYFNSGDVNRSHNLALAASHINKTIIAPNITFSLNDTVGERSAANGFLDAKIIVGDTFELGLGGGVCQVSSTLYNACLLAGLEIVERSNHSLAVAYVPLGLDATVAYGVQDYKFKNNTDSPVYIQTVTSGGELTVNIYGNLRYKQYIELSHVVDQTIDFSTVTELDPNLASGEQRVDHNGQPGYVVRSFRTFYDKAGNVVRTELLARDTYSPLNQLIWQGP